LTDSSYAQLSPLSFSRSPAPSSLQQPSSFRLSPWFPSVPASAYNGIFEFTMGGTAHLNEQYFKNANYNITLQITSTSSDSIAGKLWIEKKGYIDKGIDFNISNISNNCKHIIFDRQ
jgi:hypothetical protein